MFGAISKQITSLVIAASSLFSSHVTPIFQDCSFQNINNVFVFSCRIFSCYNNEIDKILQSGQNVQLSLTYRIFEVGRQLPVHENSIKHSLKYDVVDKFYTIDREEGEDFFSLDFNEAKQNFAFFEDIQVLHIDFFEEGREYILEITAELGSVFLVDMDKNIELMKYWKRPPVHRSTPFDVSDIQQ
ncbi:MAG TPA: hypothetical protein ENG70_03080 [Candidatus Cloacimonetes bacterium]|nr:hypothetical protein [Candidatus Cloacimonadota bacterium]HEX37827.1 hypothetical protein [Candidatus Cloacimonadota bacterium]